ncbi:MAG: sugar ABC transporter permease, partial [Nitrososphaeraceae archaeon]|nr:sugar ABC transporter permease [Nitrososphaeraceae archaeon]
LAPALAILIGFLLFPLIWNIYLSLHDVSLTTILGDWKYVGLKNFDNLIHDQDFHTSLQVSLIFVGGSVALQFFVGMVLAVVLNQQISGSNTIRALFIIPWTVSAVITGFSFKFIFSDSFGIMNYGLAQMGLEPVAWLSDPGIVVWTLVFANVWHGTPFTVIFLTAGLFSISPVVYEAARIDGATKIKSFLYITLPLLRPFIIINLILITMWSVNFFDLILVMTNGGPLFSSTTSSLFMYRQAFEFGLLSKGAAVGFLLIAMNLVLAYTYIKLLRSQDKTVEIRQ